MPDHIQIDDLTPRVAYSVGGTPDATFDIPFPFFATTDVKVRIDGVLLDPADYTVTGDSGWDAGYPAGDLVLDTAVANKQVVVYRDMPVKRVTDFLVSAGLSIRALNTDLDRLTAMVQQVEEIVGRSIRLPITETGGAAWELPAERAGKVISFDENGDPLYALLITDQIILPLAVSQGGTAADTAAAARTNLGLGTVATQAASAVSITGGSVSGITDLAVADGGTGASSASAARNNLGIAIGTDVQAYDAELAAIAGLTSAADRLSYFTGSGTAALATFTAAGRALVDDADATAQRVTLGLVIGTDVQAQDAELAAIAGLTSAADRLPYFTGLGTAALATFTTAGRALVDDADNTAQRTTLGLGTIATQGASAVAITGGSVTGITDITVADGGTGASTASGARTNLGLVIGTDVQAQDADLTAIAALTSAANKVAYATGTGTWALTDFTAAGRALVDDADAAAQRVTLGLDTMATQAASAVAVTGGSISGLTSLGAASAAITGGMTVSNSVLDVMTVAFTDAGSGPGPVVILDRISATPAASDQLAFINFNGRDSAGNPTTYAFITTTILDPANGSEDGAIGFATMQAGSSLTAMTLALGLYMRGATSGDMGAGTINATEYYDDGVALTAKYAQLGISNVFTASQNFQVAATGTAIQATCTDAGAGAGPDYVNYRDSASPAASDALGRFIFYGRDSAANVETYAAISASILDPTSTSEDGQLLFQVPVAGAFTSAMTLANGLIVGAPTGGFKGTGTINATAVYDDNVLLTCYVLEAERTGKVSTKFWDEQVPNRIIAALTEKRLVKAAVYEEARDQEGALELQGDGTFERLVEAPVYEVVEVEPEQEIARTHTPARAFAQRKDELDPAVFTAKWRDTGVLPGFPAPDEWKAGGGLSTGAMVQRLWELCELQAVHIGRLTDRVAALEASP